VRRLSAWAGRPFKPTLAGCAAGLLDHSYSELPMLSDHAVASDALPPIHKDLFDRLLAAPAIVAGITLLTGDSLVARYPGAVRLV